jgi:hypothetical protein
MAIWSQTHAKIKIKIEVLARRLSGQNLTYDERQIVSDAINEALQQICVDRGVSRWRFLQTADTEDTTASTAYVDLDENIYNVISGTVRIASEDKTLEVASIEHIYSTDPDQDDESCPDYYAFDNSTDPETIRLIFKPIPDAVYTISFIAESIVDEDAVTSFPAWMHGMVIDLATSIALRRLALGDPEYYYRKYRERRNDAKESQGHDGPQYINRVNYPPPDLPLQSRTP